METGARWEYQMSCVDDDIDENRENLKSWAEAGWELVSASAANHQEDSQSHIRYITYWRKPTANA
jgi:hypothetical protein